MLTNFSQNTWLYSVIYFISCSFYMHILLLHLDPKQISENLQRTGAFIRGVRPGVSTRDHLGHIVTRITLVGPFFWV